ncbi:unnamed protein product [Lampetra planeri]
MHVLLGHCSYSAKHVQIHVLIAHAGTHQQGKGREILRSRGRAAQMGDEEEEEARAVSRGSLAALVRHLGTPRPRDRPACAPRRASSARVHIELQER